MNMRVSRRFYKSELTVSGEVGTKNRNFLGVLVSILVLTLISSMIVAAIVIINPEIVNFPSKAYNPREAVSLEDAFLGELYPSHFQGLWLDWPRSGQSGQPAADELLFDDAKNINSIRLPADGWPWNATDRPSAFEPNVTTIVANSSLLLSVDFEGYKLSPSKRYLLVWTNRSKQFRHSFTAKFYIYDVKLDLISLVSTAGLHSSATKLPASFQHLDSENEYLNEGDAGNEFTRFQHVDWFSFPRQPNKADSQEGARDALILIQNNDIYLLKNLSIAELASKEQLLEGNSMAPVRLTHSGKRNEIFNGIPDWLYEEEILADTPAFQVSPEASSLAYMSFNDSLVELMPFSIYGPYSQVIPETRHIRYSKAGRPNPQVSVFVVDNLRSLPGGQPEEEVRSLRVELPEELSSRQHYIYRINWLTEDKLGLSWINRNQNESCLLVCSRESNWRCQVNLQQSSPGGWLDIGDDFFPLDEHSYLALLLKDEGPEVGKFKHVARVSLSEPNSLYFLTGGRREVVSIDGLDRVRKLLYYTASVEGEPGQRQSHFLEMSPRGGSGHPGGCLTCDLYPEECLYNSIKLSPSSSYYVFECHGPGVPRYELRSIWRRPEAGRQQTSLSLRLHNGLIWPIEENLALKYKISSVKAMPLSLRLRVPIANTNYSANVLMLLPPQLGYRSAPAQKAQAALQAPFFAPLLFGNNQDQLGRSGGPPPSSRHASSGEAIEHQPHQFFTADSVEQYAKQLAPGQQFPMIVDVYGGPNSQKVDFRFSVNFGHYMASSRRTIYTMIDARGSGYEGTRRLYELYRRFGTVEIQDQIDTASRLARAFPFIDPDKVAIWGWSYGGYAAAMALAQSTRQARQQQNSPSKAEGALKSAGKSAQLARQPTSGVFQCAASVAPVTNWIYYDTAYTERYMSSPYLNERYDHLRPGDHLNSSEPAGNSPQELINKLLSLGANQSPSLESLAAATSAHANSWLPLSQTANASRSSAQEKLFRQQAARLPASLDLNDRYKAASLIANIASIDKKRFLLIHGTADDNVHFQQSVMLMKQLISKNILYESRLYPDQDHAIGLGGKTDKLHLGSTLSNFFAECFDLVY